ncbi:MAG: HD domain-containing protein [Spirochaetales bacterium]|jgi:putative nucleotidyltransferase with HDIG domain|nr:HD domain-containing protein [Spirochaetales bacterium]
MDSLLSFDKNTLIRDLFESMNEIMAGRDYTTYAHSMKVAEIAKQIGTAMGLSSEKVEILELAGLVHDIGKTAIPYNILLKPDLFSSQDRRIMNYHPLIGAKLFAARLQDDQITHIILRHHERLDGSGYPLGLRGDSIDGLSRITAVADVYEALISSRPYKKPLSSEKALAILRHEVTLNHLDAEIVAVLGSIAGSLILKDVQLIPTAGFMQEIEHFRRDTFFRDALTDLFNYRYLLVLDDLNLLGETGAAGYEIHLINFHNFNELQQKYGFIIGNQVHDEVGQRLRDTVECFAIKLEQYEGSIMLFRKNCDYMIYSEANKESDLQEFFDQIKAELLLTDSEWGLEAYCFRHWFPREISIEEAFTRIFALEAEKVERCKNG